MALARAAANQLKQYITMTTEETKIENDCLEFLNSLPRSLAVKTPTKGRKIGNIMVKAGRWERPGKSDIDWIYWGLSIKIEVKTDHGIQQQNQKDYEADVAAAGGEYWLVRSLNELITKVSEFRETELMAWIKQQ